MTRLRRCSDCGRSFKDLKRHVRNQIKRLNPRRAELIDRESLRPGDMTVEERAELEELESRMVKLVRDSLPPGSHLY